MSRTPSYRTTGKQKKFLGVRFESCACYGRLYMNEAGDAYVGRCPKCYKAYHVRIGEGGTSSRMFLARCR